MTMWSYFKDGNVVKIKDYEDNKPIIVTELPNVADAMEIANAIVSRHNTQIVYAVKEGQKDSLQKE